MNDIRHEPFYLRSHSPFKKWHNHVFPVKPQKISERNCLLYSEFRHTRCNMSIQREKLKIMVILHAFCMGDGEIRWGDFQIPLCNCDFQRILLLSICVIKHNQHAAVSGTPFGTSLYCSWASGEARPQHPLPRCSKLYRDIDPSWPVPN